MITKKALAFTRRLRMDEEKRRKIHGADYKYEKDEAPEEQLHC